MFSELQMLTWRPGKSAAAEQLSVGLRPRKIWADSWKRAMIAAQVSPCEATSARGGWAPTQLCTSLRAQAKQLYSHSAPADCKGDALGDVNPFAHQKES